MACFTIRTAVPDDAEAITEIYNFYVDTSTATWQHGHATTEERRSKIVEGADRYPTIVAERDGIVVGYGYIAPFRPREGWLPTVENSVYVRDGFHRQGIGSAILAELIARARALGYHSIVAGTSADQAASLALHEAHGFNEVGRIYEGGIKFGKRLDVVFLQLLL